MGRIFSRLSHAYEVFRAKQYLRKLGGTGGVVLRRNTETGFAELIIDNVGKRNAINGKMMLDFCDAISTLEKWEEGKCLLIRGEGDDFCSGGDLDMVKQLVADQKPGLLSLLMTDCLTRLSHLHLITAVFINGIALGGGAEITSSADFRIIAPKARVGFIHRKMGIVPAWGGTSFLKRILGTSKTLQVLLKGELYSAEDALHLGLADYLEDNGLEGAKQKLQGLVDGLHPDVVKGFKKSILSNSTSQQAAICNDLIGGEQNIQALKSRIKHKT